MAQLRKKRGTPRSQALDLHIGERLKMLRTLRGLSQSDLAEAIGLTFQQIQKYERGTNRIAASMLWHMAEILDVPASFFFDQFEERDPTQHTGQEGEAAPEISFREMQTIRNVRGAPEPVGTALSALTDAIADMFADPTSPLPRRRRRHALAAEGNTADSDVVTSTVAEPRSAARREAASQADKGASVPGTDPAKRQRRRRGVAWDWRDIKA